MQNLVMLPGLASDGALFAAQARDLADIADVTIGDTLQDDSLPAMAQRVLATAPERFALAGLSMGGYLAFEILRQAPQRVTRLALLDTSARADTPEATKTREDAIAAVGKVPYEKLCWASLPRLVAEDASETVKQAVVAMSLRVGPDTYIRQQRAIMARPIRAPTWRRSPCRRWCWSASAMCSPHRPSRVKWPTRFQMRLTSSSPAAAICRRSNALRRSRMRCARG